MQVTTGTGSDISAEDIDSLIDSGTGAAHRVIGRAIFYGYVPSADQIDKLIGLGTDAALINVRDAFHGRYVEYNFINRYGGWYEGGYVPTAEQVDRLIDLATYTADLALFKAFEGEYIPSVEQVDRLIARGTERGDSLVQSALDYGFDLESEIGIPGETYTSKYEFTREPNGSPVLLARLRFDLGNGLGGIREASPTVLELS